LRHAAIGVAMGQASDEVKQFADYVTNSVDDNGIRNAMKFFGVI
jgi:hydroxymethylpyrimidine pyrophosphatase-like HAD family hydrolase